MGPRRYRVAFVDEPDVYFPVTTTPAAASAVPFPTFTRQDIITAFKAIHAALRRYPTAPVGPPPLYQLWPPPKILKWRRGWDQKKLMSLKRQRPRPGLISSLEQCSHHRKADRTKKKKCCLASLPNFLGAYLLPATIDSGPSYVRKKRVKLAKKINSAFETLHTGVLRRSGSEK